MGEAPALARWKLVLFSVVTILLVVAAVEVGLALIGVETLDESEDPHVGFSGRIPLFVDAAPADGPARKKTAPGRTDLFNPQSFEAVKPSGVQRVFCLGGSTTYGRPYDDRTSFCGWLRELLPLADPTRRWEVVNAGGISYASYRVAVVADELAGYSPDLFVVYSGHNEFLEDRTYQDVAVGSLGAGLHGTLARSRTYSQLKRWLKPARAGIGGAGDNLLPAEVSTLLDRSIGPDHYERDDAHREAVYRHFRYNLERIESIARGAGARTLLVVPASNLRNCSPFKSQPSVAAQDALARLATGMEEASRAASAGELERALAAIDRALAADPRFAEAHYIRARVLDALGRPEPARQAYLRAKEEDVCPLRAPTRVAEIVREVSAERDIASIDFEQIVGRASPDGIPGNDWFLDHVHPTIAGHRKLALRMIERMIERGWIAPADSWGPEAVAAGTARIEAALEPSVHGRAFKNLAKVYSWAGKHAEALPLASRAVELAPEDAESQYTFGLLLVQAGGVEPALRAFERATELEPGYGQAHYDHALLLQSIGEFDRSERAYRAALRALPGYAQAHNNLGVVLERLGRLDEAEASYRKALAAAPGLADAHHNLGWLLGRAGDFESARREVAAALAIRPDSADFRITLGLLLMREGRPDEAATEFREALRLRPGDAQAEQALATLREPRN